MTKKSGAPSFPSGGWPLECNWAAPAEHSATGAPGARGVWGENPEFPPARRPGAGKVKPPTHPRGSDARAPGAGGRGPSAGNAA